MTGRVEQRNGTISQLEHRLTGKYRNSAGAFQRVGVEGGVTVIDAPHPAQRTGAVQDGFGQRGFAGVYMGKNSNGQRVHAQVPFW